MSIHPTLYSSRTGEWPTPRSLFDALDREFNFTLDPCATDTNAKCAVYFTKLDDGRNQDWGRNVVFYNPPYGRGITRLAEKCW